VFLNGVRIGMTNESELKVPSGTHKLRFVKGTMEKEEVMTFAPGKNPTRLVRIPMQ
jgi:hypothetical protein